MLRGIFNKTLILILTLSIIPFIFISIYFYSQLKTISNYAIEKSKKEYNKKSIESLINQATYLAQEISNFLYERVNDLNDLALIKPTSENYLKFSKNHEKKILFREANCYSYFTVKKKIPIYREIAFIDLRGNEIIKIVNNEIIPKNLLKNISNPKNTEFKNENYFKKIIEMKGKIYFSHLKGWYVSRSQQLAGAPSPEKAIGGKKYYGLYRIGKLVYKNKKPYGIILLSLDNKIIMEFILHIYPNSTKYIEFPIYSSGNYGFIVDDQGWTIAHPKFWDIKGYYKDGSLVPPYSKNTPFELVEAGYIPFNLKYAGFIHKNYPVVYKKLLKKQSGFVNTTNIGGIKKVMAFAPILFNIGEFKKTGIFGGVTIGAKVNDFHKAAVLTEKVINKKFYSIKNKVIIIVFAMFLLVCTLSYFFVQHITSPVIELKNRFIELGRGNLNVKVNFKRKDEFDILGEEFNRTVNTIRDMIEKIKHERNFIKTIFKNMINALIFVNNKGEIIAINDMAKKIFKLTENDFGKPFYELFKNNKDIISLYEKTFKGQEFMSYEVKFQDKILGCSSSKIPHENGYIFVFRDITEKKMLDEHLKRVDRLASMGRLTAGIAHEIRNPLTGISLMLDDLHDRINDDSIRKIILKALNEIERLESLVSDLLNFSSSKNKFVKCDLEKIINSVLFFIKKIAKNKKIKLTVNVEKNLFILCDEEKIKQAIINILINSIEAIEFDGEITINGVSLKDKIKIEIIDNGCGIDQKYLKYIFDPFFTLKTNGTGLGLSITYNIIMEHKGIIDIKSIPGKGTTFIIFFDKIKNT